MHRYEGTPCRRSLLATENSADPEIRDDTQRSAQPAHGGPRHRDDGPVSDHDKPYPKVVDRAAGAATDPDGPTGRLATWLASYDVG